MCRDSGAWFAIGMSLQGQENCTRLRASQLLTCARTAIEHAMQQLRHVDIHSVISRAWHELTLGRLMPLSAQDAAVLASRSFHHDLLSLLETFFVKLLTVLPTQVSSAGKDPNARAYLLALLYTAVYHHSTNIRSRATAGSPVSTAVHHSSSRAPTVDALRHFFIGQRAVCVLQGAPFLGKARLVAQALDDMKLHNVLWLQGPNLSQALREWYLTSDGSGPQQLLLTDQELRDGVRQRLCKSDACPVVVVKDASALRVPVVGRHKHDLHCKRPTMDSEALADLRRWLPESCRVVLISRNQWDVEHTEAQVISVTAPLDHNPGPTHGIPQCADSTWTDRTPLKSAGPPAVMLKGLLTTNGDAVQQRLTTGDCLDFLCRAAQFDSWGLTQRQQTRELVFARHLVRMFDGQVVACARIAALLLPNGQSRLQSLLSCLPPSQGHDSAAGPMETLHFHLQHPETVMQLMARQTPWKQFCLAQDALGAPRMLINLLLYTLHQGRPGCQFCSLVVLELVPWLNPDKPIPVELGLQLSLLMRQKAVDEALDHGEPRVHALDLLSVRQHYRTYLRRLEDLCIIRMVDGKTHYQVECLVHVVAGPLMWLVAVVGPIRPCHHGSQYPAAAKRQPRPQ